VGNTNQSPTVERIAIAWLLGAATCVCLAIGFAMAAWLSRGRGS
jgi:ABC-type spermidine/putrescine transport system permease subunit I